MQTRNKWYIGGSFVSAAITALSAYQTIDGLANSQVKHLYWYWPVLLVLGFLVFAGIIYFGWYSEYRRNKSYEDTQPDIKVIPIFSKVGAQITIKNLGGKALFHAKAQKLVDGKPKGSEWFVMWASIYDKQLSIVKGDSGTLNIALVHYVEGRIPHICIPVAPSIIGPNSITLDHNQGNNEGNISLNIKIFADPALKRAFEKVYEISFDGDRLFMKEL